MSSNSDQKRWWEKRLDQKLADGLQNSLEVSQKMLKNIPATLSAYKALKGPQVYDLDAVPLEAPGDVRSNTVPPPTKTVPTSDPKPAVSRPAMMPSELKARQLSPEELAKERGERLRTAEKVADAIDAKNLTLAQLLDPDFCDYT